MNLGSVKTWTTSEYVPGPLKSLMASQMPIRLPCAVLYSFTTQSCLPDTCVVPQKFRSGGTSGATSMIVVFIAPDMARCKQ